MKLITATCQGPFRRVVACVAVCSLILVSFAVSGCTQKSTTKTTNILKTIGAAIALAVAILQDPSGADLVAFDPSQPLVNLQLSNLTIASTSGTGTLTITDNTTGQTLGQQTFGYVVRGTSVYAQDPTAVHNWLLQFSSAADVTVGIQFTTQLNAVTQGAASATSLVEYQGVTLAAATSTLPNVTPLSPSCPPNEPCPVGPPQN